VRSSKLYSEASPSLWLGDTRLDAMMQAARGGRYLVRHLKVLIPSP